MCVCVYPLVCPFSVSSTALDAVVCGGFCFPFFVFPSVFLAHSLKVLQFIVT